MSSSLPPAAFSSLSLALSASPANANANATASSVASSMLPPAASSLYAVTSASASSPFGRDPVSSPSGPTPIRAEGKTAFWTLPGDVLRYMVVSDKLETVIALESRKSRQKWECRLDDAKMKQCGPETVELPRHVVVGFLVEKLTDQQSGAHRLLLQRDGDQLTLALTLVFSPLFAPTYTIRLDACAMSREDLLQSQVHELQDEVDELRRELVELRQFVKAHLPVATSTPDKKPFELKRAKPLTEPNATSQLNAKAAEFVFGQPAPMSSSSDEMEPSMYSTQYAYDP